MNSHSPADRDLLRQEGRACAADTKSVRVVRFEVPAGVAALALRFDYAPRQCEQPTATESLVRAAFALHTRAREPVLDDAEARRLWQTLGLDARVARLDNLLNVVLIDAHGRWRGRWDRNPSSDSGALLVGREIASPGFIPGAIEPGTWTAAIEFHGVFGAPVDYQLEVTAAAAVSTTTPAPSAELAAATSLESAAARLSSVDSPVRAVPPAPRWLLGELHSHTLHSDGKHDLAELAAKVKSLGGEFLALTDHNTLSGHLDPGALPVALLTGYELTTFHGHHPIYLPPEAAAELVPWHVDGRVRSLAEIAPIVRAQGALVSVAHPHALGDPVCTGCRAPADLDPRHFDLLEVWYKAWDNPGCDNRASYALWDRLWHGGHRVTAVAARDWHGRDQDGRFPGSLPLTAVRAVDGSARAIFAGLRSGAVVMTAGPLVELTLDGGDAQRASIGGTIHGRRSPVVVVTVDRLPQPATLRLLRSGVVVHQQPVPGDGAVELPAVADQPGWYRAELWRGEQAVAITNHVVWQRD